VSFHAYFILFLAFLTFIVAPRAPVWTFIAGKREKAGDRPSDLDMYLIMR
jgi:hypothetical protein